ncbi:MAG: glycosyltransferase family 4 protein [Phycisphaerae bacterium]
MRIAWLAQHLWPQTVGGVELQVEALSRHMQSFGHDVELWIGDFPRGEKQKLPDGRKVFGLGVKSSTGRLWRFNPVLKILQALKSSPDGLDVVYSPEPLLATAHILLCTGIPIVYCPGGTICGTLKWHFPENPRENVFRKWLRPARQYLLAEKVCLRRSTGIVAVSSAVKKQMLRIHRQCGARTRVIHTGYEPSEMLEKRETKIFTGICVARLHSIKNIGHLIRAWKLVRFPARQLLIVGDGSERAELEALARGDDTIRFLGERFDVPNLLAGSDVFVLPSLYEACPLAVIEAMGAGVPCITLKSVPGISDVGASGELNVDSVTGFCVDPLDVAEMAGRIDYLADHPGMRKTMADAARQRAFEQFTWKHAAMEYLHFGQAVVSQN